MHFQNIKRTASYFIFFLQIKVSIKNNFHFTIVTVFCLHSLILQLKGYNLSNFMPIDLHIISKEVIGVDADGDVISCRLLVLLNRCWKTLLKIKYRNVNSFTNCLSKLTIFWLITVLHGWKIQVACKDYHFKTKQKTRNIIIGV